MKPKIVFLNLTLILCFSNYFFAQDGNVIVNQDNRIAKLISLKKKMNAENEEYKYYKIQIYFGQRNGAQNAQKNFRESFSQWRAIMYYEEPYFKVWVGNFNTRLEADRALKKIRRKFPEATRFKPRKKTS